MSENNVMKIAHLRVTGRLPHLDVGRDLAVRALKFIDFFIF